MPLDGLTTASPLVQSLVGGASFGFLFWLRNRVDPDDPDPFDPVKFGTTMVLAALIGIAFEVGGIDPAFEHYAFVLVTFGGTVGMIEAALKALARGDRYAAQRHLERAGQSAIRTALSLGSSSGQVRDRLEEGADERAATEMSDAERRKEWADLYPEEEAYHLVDDTDDVGGTDGDRIEDGRVGEGRDQNEP